MNETMRRTKALFMLSMLLLISLAAGAPDGTKKKGRRQFWK
jgi:hypothetical protein